MINLPEVTVVAATTKDHGKTIEAIHKTLEQITPAKVLLFTDQVYFGKAWQNIVIDRFKSVEDYNHFIFKQLGQYVKNAIIDTPYILVIQHDGYVINGGAWDPAFLEYDYIGAPWTYTDGRNVGNGGFSLRSSRLHTVLMNEEFEFYSPEDEKIARYYRQTLEKKYNIKFAPDEVAHRFSFEMHKPKGPTFGFHNHFHKPWREPIILQRSGAMGDIIMMEPIMEELHKQGFRVIIDVPLHHYPLFSNHHFPVESLSLIRDEDTSQWRRVNLDMSYEVLPEQHVQESYAKACGIALHKFRNPRLNYNGSMPMFNNYIVLHTEAAEHPHRNIHGLNWTILSNELKARGYEVVQVCITSGVDGITKVNTHNTQMLAYIIAGARLFIGPDSGCAQIAVATGVPSIIFFGSVNPEYRYVLNDKIKVMQKPCPIKKDGCYHKVISVKGKECEVNAEEPPCTVHYTMQTTEEIINFLDTLK